MDILMKGDSFKDGFKSNKIRDFRRMDGPRIPYNSILFIV
jgi:hypothetical protein